MERTQHMKSIHILGLHESKNPTTLTENWLRWSCADLPLGKSPPPSKIKSQIAFSKSNPISWLKPSIRDILTGSKINFFLCFYWKHRGKKQSTLLTKGVTDSFKSPAVPGQVMLARSEIIKLLLHFLYNNPDIQETLTSTFLSGAKWMWYSLKWL